MTIGPGSFFTSLMPTLLVDGVKEALARCKGPIVLVANLLTEGRGMQEFTAADAATWVARTIGRPVDVVVFNTASARRPKSWDATRASTSGRSQLGRMPRGHEWSKAISGAPTSRATIAAGCRMRSGRC